MASKTLPEELGLFLLTFLIPVTYRDPEESLIRSTKIIDNRGSGFADPMGCPGGQDGVICERGSRNRYPNHGSVTRYSGRDGSSSIFLRSVLM